MTAIQTRKLAIGGTLTALIMTFLYPAVVCAQAELPVLTAPLPAQAGTTAVTPDWLMARSPMLQLSSPHPLWLRDGRHVVYSMRLSADSPESIQLLDVTSGVRIILGVGENPVPSPDGTRIVFTRMHNEGRPRWVLAQVHQLWIMNADGSGTHPLGHAGERLDGRPGWDFTYAWSPDSRTVALTVQLPDSTSDSSAQTSDSSRSTAIEAGTVRTSLMTRKLWLIDVTSGDERRIFSTHNRLSYMSWLPDGDGVLLTATRYGFEFGDGHTYVVLQTVRASDGAVGIVRKFAGFQQALQPAMKPDGTSIAVTYDPDDPLGVINSIAAIPISADHGNGNTPIRLTREMKFVNIVIAPAGRSLYWSPHGNSLYALRSTGAFRQIYRIDAHSGQAVRLTTDPASVSAFDLSRDGRRIVYVARDAHDHIVMRVVESTGEDNRVVRELRPSPPGVRLSEVREVEWHSRDGLPLRGVLVLPVNYHRGTRYPLVVDIHGGAYLGGGLTLDGGILESTPLEWQVWAAKGYAVFAPDYRTTGAYGWSQVVQMHKNQTYYDRNIDDILSGIDTLIASGLADSTRLAVYGHSAGAVLTNHIIGRTHRFKAAVSYEGTADYYISCASHINIGGNEACHWIHNGWPWDAPEHYWRASPMSYVAHGTTPTLFLMGDPDGGTLDVTGSVQVLYSALKRRGIDTRYVTYVGEGHNNERPANRRDALLRTIAWVESHLDARQATSN